jgi:hypothetical protein
MTDFGSPAFPAAKDDDDDDVAWGLSTAQVQWRRGSQADAVVWLRRAIDAAVSVGATWRAAELTRQTDALEAYLVSGPAAAPAPISRQGEVAIDDFDGTDIIDDEALSLPPDADMGPSLAPLSADATDELTDTTSADEQREAEAEEVEAEPEVEAIEGEPEAEQVVEIDEDDISDEDVEPEDELPRFASEAPPAAIPRPSRRPSPKSRARA